MQPKAPILVPTTAQIDQLRADFFFRLDQKGSPVAGNTLIHSIVHKRHSIPNRQMIQHRIMLEVMQ